MTKSERAIQVRAKRVLRALDDLRAHVPKDDVWFRRNLRDMRFVLDGNLRHRVPGWCCSC
jgi:hypothetical protein